MHLFTATMLVNERRPDVPVEGFWLRSAVPGEEARIHVLALAAVRVRPARHPDRADLRSCG
jgi:hypothetical protein